MPDCTMLEQRLERLERFVWEHHVMNECNGNTDGICDLADNVDCHCSMDICSDPAWVMR